jgi:hypothetical protein
MEKNTVSDCHDVECVMNLNTDMNKETSTEEMQNNRKRRKVLKIGEVVERLSEIYGFDLREAQEHLGMDNDGRLKKGRPRILKDESQNAEEKIPKKRGRPPKKKDENEVLKVPRKRGRPPRPPKREYVSNSYVTGVEDPVLTALLAKHFKKESDDESSQSSFDCSEFEVDSKLYLRSEANQLFDPESHDLLGEWNEETKTIKFYYGDWSRITSRNS